MSDNVRIVRGEILAPGERDLRMPVGTPLGLGFLGAARFSAIRRVLEHAERAAQAKVALIDAEGGLANAIGRREFAREQLLHLDTIREDAANQINFAFEARKRAEASANRREQAAIELEEIAAIRRQAEKMEAEDALVAAKAKRAKAANNTGQASSAGSSSDQFTAFMNQMKRMPDIAKTAAAVKEQIIKEAGENATEASEQMTEMVDAMLNAFMQKQAEDSLL